MGNVVALDEFKRTLGKQSAHTHKWKRPDIRGSEIWGRDYTDIEAIVFGLLKVRDIVAYYSGGRDHEFDQLSMDALDAAYTVHNSGPAKLKATIKPLKEWILDSIDEDNKRDMSWALIIYDLVEKSPAR